MKLILTVLLLMALVSCSNNTSETRSKLDSIGKEIDTVAGRTWDSTKAKARELRERVEGKFNRKDSVTNQ